MTKPIMYQNRLLWEEVERQLIDGIWQIMAEGKLDLVNFDALPAGIHAVVLHHPLRNDVRVIQSFYDDDNYKRFMFNAPYRSDYWLQDGWYAYFLTDHKGFQNGELTMQAHLFVAEGYDKYPEAFDPMTIAKELAVKAATPSKPLNAPMVHILNCRGQTVDMATLNDNTFIIEGEGAFVGPIEVSTIDPNGANKVKKVQTEGLMRNYRTWQHPLTKVRPGKYKIHVRSLDNAVRDEAIIQFVAAASNVIEDIVYATGSHTFYALSAAECQELDQAAQPLAQAIQKVVEAYREEGSSKKAKLTQAKQDLNQVLQPLIGASSSDITEMVRFKGKKYTYVPSNKIKGHWRSYQLKSDADAKSITTQGKIDVHKLKAHFPRGAEMQLFSSETEISGSITGWAQSVNQSGDFNQVIFGSDKTQSHFVATAHDQLLRYTAGTSTEATFEPTKGHVGFSTNGHAELAVAQAKVNFKGYLPNAQGVALSFRPLSRSGAMQSNKINLGNLRAELDASLFGFVGASVLGSIQMECAMPMDAKGNAAIKVKGSNRTEHDDGTSIGVGVDAFAGAKAGCESAVKLCWQNPEQQMSWSEFASLSAEGDVAAGVGGAADFEIHYSPKTGKFVIHSKAALICGPGVIGKINTVVYANHILSFVEFCYHKIMSQNFKYVGFMAEDAFEYLCLLMTRYILDTTTDLDNIASNMMAELKAWWTMLFVHLDSGDLLSQLEGYASSINQNPSRLRFAPPEVKGRLLCLFTDPLLLQKIQQQVGTIMLPQSPYELMSNSSEQAQIVTAQLEQIQRAIVHILEYIQSEAEYINVLQHMSFDGSKITQSHSVSEQQLYQGLGEYGRYLVKHDPHINELVNDLSKKIVYATEPAYNQPVQANTKVGKYA